MSTYRRRRVDKFRNRKKNSIFIKRRIIVFLTTIILVLACIFIAKSIFKDDEDNISTKAETTENVSETSNSGIENDDSNLDNSGYLPLEKDINAEDAVELFETTDKLIKNEIKYPVRTDGKKVVYLTFDDGPSTTNTPTVLDILKENNIKATFMIMGKNAESSDKSKEILKRTVQEGHAIGNHTYGHDFDYLCPYAVQANGKKKRTMHPTNIMADLDKCDKTLKSILGKDFYTRVIRIPGGYFSWEGRTEMKPILVEKGLGSINWNILNEDAEGKANKTAAELLEISKKHLDELGPDADSVVFLMHDTYYKEETAKSLQGVIDMFKERGFEFKTIK